jgi:hypothetical protein
VRAFARRLLTDNSKLTVSEVIERKRIARVLQAMIGDEPYAWSEWELDYLRDEERARRTLKDEAISVR